MTQAQALDIMSSGKSVFLTGAPGAGKTYVLDEFVRRSTRRRRRVAVTASTGIAATDIGGPTIHLWSGLGTRKTLTDTGQGADSTPTKDYVGATARAIYWLSTRSRCCTARG